MKMKVELIDYTGAWAPDPARYAAAQLIMAKSTRLDMSGRGLLDSILYDHDLWDQKALDEELKKIAETIPSSWEFVRYTILVTGVTRAFTHQLVRTRTQSYAQQAMRVARMKGFAYRNDVTREDRRDLYDDTMTMIQDAYNRLLELGVEPEDARGILPTNVLTNILVGTNLRALAETMLKRSSPRVQGEYREFMDLVYAQVTRVHPFTRFFLDRADSETCDEISKELTYLSWDKTDEIEVVKERKNRIWKLIDRLRGAQR